MTRTLKYYQRLLIAESMDNHSYSRHLIATIQNMATPYTTSEPLRLSFMCAAHYVHNELDSKRTDAGVN